MIRAFCAVALLALGAWCSPNLGLARSANHIPTTAFHSAPLAMARFPHPLGVQAARDAHRPALDRFPAPYALIGAAHIPIVQAHVFPDGMERLLPDSALEESRAPAKRPDSVQASLRPDPRPATIAHGVPQTLEGADSLTCIAVALYHEARDQGVMGQQAVASVILERAANRRRWGNTPCTVVVPVQFSFMTSRYAFPPITDMPAWERAKRIASDMLARGPLPALKGADHYHATYVDPDWAPKMVRVNQIKDHIFYTSLLRVATR